jgi:hypothetical protein
MTLGHIVWIGALGHMLQSVRVACLLSYVFVALAFGHEVGVGSGGGLICEGDLRTFKSECEMILMVYESTSMMNHHVVSLTIHTYNYDDNQLITLECLSVMVE